MEVFNWFRFTGFLCILQNPFNAASLSVDLIGVYIKINKSFSVGFKMSNDG